MASLDAREFTVGAAAGFALAMCAAYAYQQRERKRDTARKPIGRRRSLTSDQSYLQGQRSDARPHHTAAVKAWQRAKDDVLSQFRAKYPAGFGSELVLLSQIKVDNVFLLPVPHLSDYHEGADLPNRMGIGCANKEELQQSYNKLMGDQDVIIHDIVRKPNADPVTTAYLRAGPRDVTHFNPCKVRAAIVTCGGLCPGLNNVIQGIVRALISLYGAEKVYGVRGGYQGFSDPNFPPVELTLANVVGLQHKGGTMIGTGRGSFDLDKTMGFLKQNRISQLYVVGGDGTHRAANKIAEEARRLKLNIAVCGIPKTIDNDIDLIDRAFGFNTAVEEAQAAIESAQTEARCNLPNGIGIVKLMGRHSGFIAVHATMCSGDVDLCLVPEVPVVMDGPKGCLPHLERVLDRKGFAVIVVAEGAGEEILGRAVEVDKGGNRKLPELGKWLKDEIGTFFDKRGKPTTVKYIDPSYMIRSVPANASDAIYTALLAQNAVHGAMAGYTAFSVGMANNRLVYIPISSLVKNSPRIMDPMGRTWERVLSVTGQPNTAVKIDSTSAAISTRTII
ncbi:hypothetical protein KFE25_003621 [Diacronema lutheri]|uniref:Rhodanese domain-containing protein n=1 Tax=Diacronema lutheri TaxID=2081491 RepID=A0A8J5XCF4_DIALT|nr:hypothetical protein KFE25_003621 [Diacronema lutheri]